MIGRHWTRLLALSGEIIDAATAEGIGLVQKVVPHEVLLDQALGFARAIGERVPMGVTTASRSSTAAFSSSGVAESIEATALLFTTDDHKAGVRAFLGKTTPEFEGR